MKDTLNFSDYAVRLFIEESIAHINRYYTGEEKKEFLTNLGINVGMAALRSAGAADYTLKDHEAFAKIADNITSLWGDRAHVLNSKEEISLIFLPCDKIDVFSDESARIPFYKGLAGSVATRFYGDTRVNAEVGESNEFIVKIYLINSKEASGEDTLYIKLESLPVRDISFMNEISVKTGELLKKIRNLEVKVNELASEKPGKDAKNNELQFFRMNQELEKTNIELKAQNTKLIEKNTELAFRLIDLEESYQQAAEREDTLERKSFEENIKTDEQTENLNRKISELEANLRQSEKYLEVSNYELQNRLTELDVLKKENAAFFLAKESMDAENMMIKKQLQYRDDMVRSLELEKESLLGQLEDLEKLNEELQENYLRKTSGKFSIETKKEDIKKRECEFCNQILKVLSNYIGDSAEIVFEKSLAKTIDDEKILDLPSQKKARQDLISSIGKVSHIIISDKEISMEMMNKLAALIE